MYENEKIVRSTSEKRRKKIETINIEDESNLLLTHFQ